MPKGEAIKIERLEVKDGQFGPYTVFSAGGESYSAFGRFHKDLARYKVGDDVDFQWEQKGNFKRVTNVGAGSSPSVPSYSQPQGPRTVSASAPSAQPSRGDGPNLGMMVSYAKDLIVGNPDLTPAEAVAIIKDITRELTKPEEAPVKEVV